MFKDSTNKIPHILSGVLLFFCVFRFPSDSMRASFEVMTETGVIIAFSCYLFKRNAWLSMFVLSCCISSFYPQYDKASFLAMHAVFYGCVWYFLMFEYGSLDLFRLSISIIVLVNVLAIVLQMFNMCPFFQPLSGDKDVVAGLMSNKNETSALFAFCGPVFFEKKWRWFLIPVVFGLIMTSSLGGMISFAAASAYYFYPIIGKLKGFVLLLFAISVCFCIDTPSTDLRKEAWEKGLSLWYKHPFGAGIGHWKYVFSGIDLGYGNTVMAQAHNEFIQALFEIGVSFIVIISGFLVKLFKNRFVNRMLTASIIVIIINSFVNFPFHIAITAYIAIAWIAFFDKRVYENKKLLS